MRMRRIFLSSALVFFTATSVMAQEEYTTEQLVDFYINSLDMGETRGICIGTEQECAPKVVPQGLDMRISFELDSADLTESAQKNLGLFAAMMKDERLISAHFVVEGHTDARGTSAYNETLSEERAASVSRFLMDQGIESQRLSAIGLGETQPRTEDIMDPENRRVELRINLN